MHTRTTIQNFVKIHNKKAVVFPKFLESHCFDLVFQEVERAKWPHCKMFLRYCMHMRTCAAERHKQAANYWGPGPAPTREVGNLFSPEWCQIPRPGRVRRGGGLCLWTLFFSWHTEAKREGILSDHKSRDYAPVFPPLSLSLFPYVCTHTHTHLYSLGLTVKDPPGKPFSFPRRRYYPSACFCRTGEQILFWIVFSGKWFPHSE